MKKIKEKIKSTVKKIWIFILKLPIFKINNKKIVFDNFNGKGFGCNPKYIALELIKENVDCKMIWLVKDMETEMPKQIKKVKYGSLRSYYELSTAKIWIDNVRNYKGVEKKKKQFYIQTWHASIGFKKCEADIEHLLDKQYIAEAKNDGKITDVMISDSNFVTNVFKKAFWYDGKIEQIGLPRNDVLNEVPEKVKQRVYNYFNIDYSKKIVIYAPTFRKNETNDYITFDYKKCCEKLKEKFDGEFVLLIRLHPNDIEHAKQIKESDIVKNATLYPDVQELLAVSDIGITDYSSIAFDLAIVGKPVFLLCKDYEIFIKNERDLFFEMNELPFSLNISENELWKSIEDFSKEKYDKTCKEFYDRDDIKPVKTSEASLKIVQIIKEKIKD